MMTGGNGLPKVTEKMSSRVSKYCSDNPATIMARGGGGGRSTVVGLLAKSLVLC